MLSVSPLHSPSEPNVCLPTEVCPLEEFNHVLGLFDLYVEPRGARRGRWLTEVVQRGAREASLPRMNSWFVLFCLYHCFCCTKVLK